MGRQVEEGRSEWREAFIFQVECNGHAIRLPPGRIEIGRGVCCFIRIGDPSVSRVHVRLEVAAHVTATDLDSANGTWVNGRRLVGSCVLDDGDTLQVGDQRLRLCLATPDFDDGETVVRGGTLQGVGAVQAPAIERCCPRCRRAVAMGATYCCSCGVLLPVGAAAATTEPTNPVVRQRVHQRIAVAIPVHYTSDNMVLDGVVRDISEGGLFIESKRVDHRDTFCRLVLQPPNSAEVVVHGWVRNIVVGERGRGMGIEFAGSDATDELRSRLAR